MTQKDEYIRVLDFLERGRAGQKDEPVAHGIGAENFNLLEVVMRDEVRPKGGQELYIGEGQRDEVKYIKGRISFDDLTSTGQKELDYVLKALVDEKEEKFVRFFNEATPVTPRRHAFELLPGVGTKLMQNLLDEREKEEFESFKDIKERVSTMPEPSKLVVDRIIKELKGEAKQKLFT
ncbi:DUF655 domain-containing protein [Candidatus Nanohalococcus occultus]|uniref:DUF655 domain-containing protein n=1 Tax=Candidatus Nanohalococcus occultus TaxID=2978047 RepID=UPI0039E08F68